MREHLDQSRTLYSIHSQVTIRLLVWGDDDYSGIFKKKTTTRQMVRNCKPNVLRYPEILQTK